MTNAPWTMTNLAFNFIYSDLLWKPRVISPGNVLTRQFPRKRAIWSLLKMALFQPCLLAKWQLYWNASANLLKQAGPPKDLPKFLYHWAHKGCTFPSGYPCYPGEKQVGNLDEFSWKKNLERVCDCPQTLPDASTWGEILSTMKYILLSKGDWIYRDWIHFWPTHLVDQSICSLQMERWKLWRLQNQAWKRQTQPCHTLSFCQISCWCLKFIQLTT